MFGPALRKAWDLLRARYVFGYLLHGDQEWTEFEIVLPPTTLLGSANAGCIFDGLWCTGFASKLAQYSKNMRMRILHIGSALEQKTEALRLKNSLPGKGVQGSK